MENLYDPNLATVFWLTQEFYEAQTHAQRVWVKKEAENWKKRIGQLTEIRTIDLTVLKDGSHGLLKANLVLPGRLKDDSNLNPKIAEGITSTIKKLLAQKILEEFPVCNSSQIWYAAGEAVKFCLYRINDYWTGANLRSFREGEINKALAEMVSSFADAETIRVAILDGTGKPPHEEPYKKLLFELKFRLDVQQVDIFKIVTGLVEVLKKFKLGASAELIRD